jgi:cytochrome c-type protein NapC
MTRTRRDFMRDSAAAASKMMKAGFRSNNLVPNARHCMASAVPTIHFTNRSGVRAKCSDCHVPHDWTDKIARKMQASKEVWGWVFGTINIREKFLDMRPELAQREWERLRANDSLERRNCHDYDSMDFTRQSQRGAYAHSAALETGAKTCIDCHKGIAHRLPNMAGIQ